MNKAMGATGLEHPSIPTGKSQVSDSGGSKSGNKSGNKSGSNAGGPEPTLPTDPPADPDLAALVRAWPDLPPALRAGIVALVRTARAD